MPKLRYLVYNKELLVVKDLIDKCKEESRNMELLKFQVKKLKNSQDDDEQGW